MASASRPVSVTIIAWLLIIGGVFGALSTPYYAAKLNDPAFRSQHPELANVPTLTAVDIAIGMVGAIGGLVAGVFMLQGAGWARLLYIGLCVINVAYTIVRQGPNLMMVPTILITLLFIALLFTQKANAYFDGSK